MLEIVYLFSALCKCTYFLDPSISHTLAITCYMHGWMIQHAQQQLQICALVYSCIEQGEFILYMCIYNVHAYML